MTRLFHQAAWIWTGDDEAHDAYREARQEFELTASHTQLLRQGERLELYITADALYQVALNGSSIGHGPAKSAKGTRGVDCYDLSSLVKEGRNQLDIVVLAIGVSTMTYCLGKPGLRFEVRLGDFVLAASGPATSMRTACQRTHPTVRRWILPCIEDVDAAAALAAWEIATVVERELSLYARRIPLPSREPLLPRSILLADRVALPNFSVSFRHKPYLVPPDELVRTNTYDTPAYVVIELISPIDQALMLTPTNGAFDWYYEGIRRVNGNGWAPFAENVTLELKAGANRLVGLHKNDHFGDFSLAGFCQEPIEVHNPFGEGGFQVVPLSEGVPAAGETLPEIDWEALRPDMPAMDPAHTMPWANAHDLVLGAEVLASGSHDGISTLTLQPAPAGEATRLIVDLGMVHNGWLACDVRGQAGSRLIFSFFEGIDAGPPLRLHWPFGCQNALTYRLSDGKQHFESFHPYGGRYIAIHHTGDQPVTLTNLRLLTANCGSHLQGFLQSSDPLLNQIYQIAVQTVISSVDDTYTDCPTFEQVNWNFDNRTAFLGEILTCANTAVARHSIELFAEDPEFTGLVRSQYPSAWDNFIPLWSMHWIMWVRDYAEATGDLDFARRMFPRIRAGITEILAKVDDRGLLAWEGAWHFIEWGHGRDDNHAICGHEQAGLVGTLQAASYLADLLGEGTGRAWRKARADLIEAINRELWVEERQAYADSLHADGSHSPVSSQTTNAILSLYGVASEARARDVANRIADNAPGLLPYGSPYGLYYVLELFDQFSMVEPIFTAIRHRWGDMVLAGDRTTWETFAEYGGHGGFPTRSRCHPFAAYVVKYLVKYLLGIESLEPGYARCRIAPQPPAGVAACYGAVPTPHGLIRVGWVLIDGEPEIACELPPALTHVP